jgi:ribonucleoside-diphosphate reductase alpha chain
VPPFPAAIPRAAIHTRLARDRAGITHRFTIGAPGPDGLKGYITANCYPDGRPAEVFLTLHKTGTLERGMSNALAVVVSMALQHGIPLATITSHLKGMTFEPQGPTSNPAIPWVKSLADYLGRWLELKFLPPSKTTEEPHAAA